jgi:RND family efflux transporter MFP subunit
MREEIRSATANFEFNQRNQKRLQDLYKKNAIPFHKLDEADTNLAVSDHRLQQAKDNNRLAELEADIAREVLARREVKSPFDGVVVKRYKSVGEYVEEEPVLQLVQLNPLRVQVLLPVSIFGQITPGMTAKVLPEAPMNQQSRQAAVVLVDSVVDVASGTFAVELELENEGNQLPSGLKCGLRFLQ